jgi:cation:H+ antiporter
MNMWLSAFFIVGGVILLYFGGEFLVRNAVRLARGWGVSTMVVSLTVVAFGTSSPELAASLTAALQGSSALVIGNVVGSNLFNVLFILGLTALIASIRVQAQFIKREVPIMVGATLLLFPVLYFGGDVTRFEGGLLVGLLAGYIVFLYRSSNGESAEVQAEYDQEYSTPAKVDWRAYAGVVFGLALLGVGARVLVIGAVDLARGFGVPELVIGLTIVAAGTSMPEVAASVVAALRREPDIALGNIVGSNIFNVLGILGVTAVVQPINLSWSVIERDMWVMLGGSLLLWPFLVTGTRLGKREGGILLGLYVAYLALVLTTTRSS